jgi:hypothetical protein
MRSDTEIRSDGFQVLFKHMDSIEAERFISLINAEQSDYTKWRQNLFEEMTIEEIFAQGREFAINFRKIKGKTGTE